MRAILAIVILATLAWSGYWYVGAQSMQDGTARWFSEQNKAGWQASATVKTGGFPYRFDTKLTDVKLARPDYDLAWSAPWFQFLALSYQPSHFIAIWPPEQILTTAGQRITIKTDPMRASVIFKPDPRFPLDRANLVATSLQLNSDKGWSAGAYKVLLATRRDAEDPAAHEIGVEVDKLRLPADLRARLDPQNLLPGNIEQLKLDAALTFDGPWDRSAIEQNPPRLTAIDLKNAQARWGDLQLEASGKLTIDAEGYPTGNITVTAMNWRQLLDMAEAWGSLSKSTRPALEGALQALTMLSGEPDKLTAPLSIQNRIMSFGPFPLGPAPRLGLR